MALLLLRGIICGQGHVSWDNTALVGAGMPPLSYRSVPLLAEGHNFPVLDAIPYRNHRDEGELLILGRRGQIWSVPRSGVQGSVKQHQVANVSEDFKNRIESKPPHRSFQLLSGILDRDWPKRPYIYLAIQQQTGTDGECRSYAIR